MWTPQTAHVCKLYIPWTLAFSLIPVVHTGGCMASCRLLSSLLRSSIPKPLSEPQVSISIRKFSCSHSSSCLSPLVVSLHSSPVYTSCYWFLSDGLLQSEDWPESHDFWCLLLVWKSVKFYRGIRSEFAYYSTCSCVLLFCYGMGNRNSLGVCSFFKTVDIIGGDIMTAIMALI